MAPKKNLNYDDPLRRINHHQRCRAILEFPRGIFATVYLHHPRCNMST